LTKEANYMKKNIASMTLFLIIFVVTYLLICFAIPGMRIKLAAEPMEYFVESVRHMAFIKTVISLAVSFAIGTISFLVRKSRS